MIYIPLDVGMNGGGEGLLPIITEKGKWIDWAGQVQCREWPVKPIGISAACFTTRMTPHYH